MSNLSPKNTLNLSLVHKIRFKAEKLTTKASKISTFPSVSLIDSLIQLSGFKREGIQNFRNIVMRKKPSKQKILGIFTICPE